MIRKLILMSVLAMFLCTTSNAFAENVYITKNGKKYHKQDCSLIKNKETKSIDKEEAIKKGYTPCKRCFKEDVVVDKEKKEETKNNKK